MKQTVACAMLTLMLLPAPLLCSEAKDADKLDAELEIIELTASIADGRRIVNRVMSNHLKISRQQLVAERQETGLDYGRLFAAHEFARLAPAAFDHVVSDVDAGQAWLEIGRDHGVRVKKVLASARKLNKALDKALDAAAAGDQDELAAASDEGYDPNEDFVAADTASLTAEQLALANERMHNRPAANKPGSNVGSPLAVPRGRASRRGGGHGPGA
jgi:hypothetical protein